MSKSDLLDRLWPGTFVVEKNLANLISEIRRAIRENPSSPQFVRTVHRFGYAFRDTLQPAEAEGPATRDSAALFQVKWIDNRVTIGEGEHVLGRDPDAGIFIDSPSVSRRHAVIRISAGRATIADLGSKNGPLLEINGWRVPHRLARATSSAWAPSN